MALATTFSGKQSLSHKYYVDRRINILHLSSDKKRGIEPLKLLVLVNAVTRQSRRHLHE